MKTISLLLFTILVMLSSCRAPLFRSDAELFAPAPEVIAQVQPYLEAWATTSPELTLDHRRSVESQIEGVLSIETTDERTTADGQTFYIVAIVLDSWEDWSRGYYYVYDGSDMNERPGLSLRRVDEHFYIYNLNY
jgi:hypothetical protein